jgi:hypothetical protein
MQAACGGVGLPVVNGPRWKRLFVGDNPDSLVSEYAERPSAVKEEEQDRALRKRRVS